MRQLPNRCLQLAGTAASAGNVNCAAAAAPQPKRWALGASQAEDRHDVGFARESISPTHAGDTRGPTARPRTALELEHRCRFSF
jgi:RecA-family ATPase